MVIVSLVDDGVGVVPFPLCDGVGRAARPRRAPFGCCRRRNGHAAGPERAEVRGRVVALVALSAMDVTLVTALSPKAAQKRTTPARFLGQGETSLLVRAPRNATLFSA